jgi:hypothetical protein
MKKTGIKGRYLLTAVFVVAMIISLFSPTLAMADTGIRFTTNGAAANYAPGSVLVVFGRIENEGIGVPGASTLIEADINGTKFYYSQAVTNFDGYFRAGFNVPRSAQADDTLNITVNGTEKVNFTLKSQEAINNHQGGEPFSVVGFTAPGYLAGEPVRKISVHTTTLGIVFSKNVNYFNNKNAGDLQSIGKNIKNEDCFDLYEGSKRVPISIDLLESEKKGGDEPVVYTTLDGDIAETEAKDVVFISLPDGLKANTTYRLVISGEISSNSSITLGSDQEIFFTTDGSGSSSSGGSASQDETEDSSYVSDNKISVPVKPMIKGDQAVVLLTDALINNAIKTAETDQENILSFEVTKEDAGNAHEFSLELSQTQINLLVGDIAKVAYSTPVGKVALPKEVLEQAKGKLTLFIGKVSGETDTFEVTLQDENGVINSLKGRTTLEFPVSLAGSPSDVMTHNGEIMKNSLISGGKGYAVASGFSKFAVTTNQVSFADISEHWGEQYITILAARNIINGTAPNIFAPNNNVTRAEFVKMLVNAIDGLDTGNTLPAGFNDVIGGQWYSDFIYWAADKKVVSGYQDGSFGINKNISRQEMAVIIDRFAGVMTIDLAPTMKKTAFADDSKIAPYAKDAVYKMQQAGIIGGKGSNTFDPLGNATRAEAAKMISVLIELLVK